MLKTNISISTRAILVLLLLTLVGFGVSPQKVYADKVGVCGTPGKDGPTVTLSGVINSYYPGTANVSAGATSIPVGAPRTGGGAAIAAGDLLVVVQMQGADIDATNTNNYGNGVGNGGTNVNTVTYPTGDPDYVGGNVAANFTTGQYEYVVATGPVAGGFVPVSTGLVYSYFFSNNTGGSSQGQRRYQVIRVPQYSSATLSGSVTALRWDGSTGGIVTFDVAGQLNWNGQSIDVSGLGFRGGGGRQLGGSGGLNWWDFRTLASAPTNGSKGEGYAGTPRYLNDNGSLLDNGVEGYPNGSYARGSAGNAGGGSTDGRPSNNDENSGGGGGGNGGYGGMGGNAWNSGRVSGGYGGAPFPGSAPRLIMGGGGGAGTTNNGTGLPSGFSSSGRAGGGVVFVRSGTIIGSGTINANGTDAPVRGDADVVLNDGGGGGGAGGSVVIIALNGGGSVGTLTATATGGQGGDAWPNRAGAGARHGPGGGGGGGFIYTSGVVAGGSSVAGGINGISTTGNDPFGATSGGVGVLVETVSPADLPASISGANCVPVSLITTKTTSTSNVVAGTTATYTITITNAAGAGGASGVEVSDLLSSGFTYASTGPITLLGNAVRTAVSNPLVGSGNPTWGTFLIPGGGSVALTFTVDVDINTPPGTYQNPATATYFDPVRTASATTLTSSYNPASSNGEDVTVTTLNQIVVVKDSQPDDAQDFSYTGSGPSGYDFGGGFDLDDDADPTLPNTQTFSNLTAGSYSLVEGVVTGWSLANLVCVDPDSGSSVDLGTRTASIDLDAGESITCTYTNSQVSADLAITKTDGVGIVNAGASTTYTVRVTNNGPSSVTGAVLSDPAAAGLSKTGVVCSGTPGRCVTPPTVVELEGGVFALPAMASGEFFEIEMTATVTAGSGSVTNTATVTPPAGVTDPINGNNSASDTDTVNDPPVANDDSTSTQLNTPVTFSATANDTDSDGTIDASSVDLDPATPGQQNTYTVVGEGTFTVDASGNVTFTPTATFTGTSTIPYKVDDNDGATSNPADLSVTVIDPINLTIAKTDNDADNTILVGGNFDWTVTVTSNGTSAASFADTQVLVSDSLPGLDGYYPLEGALTVTPGATAPTGTINCSIVSGPSMSCVASGAVTLPAGASFSVTFTVTPSASGSLANTAVVDPNDVVVETDESAGDNQSTNSMTVNDPVDLGLTKSNGTTSVFAGGTTTYDLSVTNSGDVPTSGTLTVVDVLPAGLSHPDGGITLGGAQSADWTCTSAINVITCTSSTAIAGSGTSTFNLTVDVDAGAGGTLVNRAQVGGGGDPTNPSAPTSTSAGQCTGANIPNEGCATDSDTVNTVNLVLAKTNGVTSVTPGGTTTYTLTVTNTGNQASSGTITVEDVLPPGLSIPPGNFTTGVWSCSAVGQNITCTSGGAIPGSGGTSTFSFTVNVDVGASGTLVNRAQVGGGGDPTNSSAPTSTSAGQCVGTDIFNEGCATDSDAVGGGSIFDPPSGRKVLNAVALPELEWRMVWINDSNTAAIGVQITDPIPAGTTYVGGSLTCVETGGSVRAGAATAPLNTAVSPCGFDPGNNRIQWQGNIAPDPGATDEFTAANEVIIAFRVTVNTGVNQVNNQASSLTDIDDDTDFTDETTVASVAVSNIASWIRGGVGDPGDPGQLPITGFAPGVITKLPEQPAEKHYVQNDLVLEIPRLDLEMGIVGVPVVDGGWDTTWLNQDAGWLQGSAYPTWAGNTVITGHVWDAFNQPGPFAKLKTLRYGDRFKIHAQNITYSYEVRENDLISPRSTEKVFQHEEYDWVTLLTCEFYNPLSDNYFFRRMVRAVLIQVEVR